MLQTRSVEEALRRVILDYLRHNDNGETSLPTLWEVLKAVIHGELYYGPAPWSLVTWAPAPVVGVEGDNSFCLSLSISPYA
ncbi:hypothetical protein NDU88_002372 [Pleurodeles waltl]|uniref:Uncharacterized protein n=1 Tax=Pleurodeles waltl TaxID=8319 RepID=A0AAV7SBF2_PLEWA|nr:hypothetical protein NDU88_002372 [Pleurodeles waltl]